MTIKQKIECSTNKTKFTLYKEGIFYKCYNEDAMVFVQHVKEYKVSTKFVKSVGAAVYSIGFPVTEVKNGRLSLEFISEKINSVRVEAKDKRVVFTFRDEFIKNGYQDWIRPFASTKKKKLEEPHADYKRILNYDCIISEIKKYDLANNTPMQSFGFIQLLKEKVSQIEEENGNL